MAHEQRLPHTSASKSDVKSFIWETTLCDLVDSGQEEKAVELVKKLNSKKTFADLKYD